MGINKHKCGYLILLLNVGDGAIIETFSENLLLIILAGFHATIV